VEGPFPLVLYSAIQR